MSQDLEEYQDIIEQLKPMINEPEFNQVLAKVAVSVSRQKRFLIKMELKRLARPCTRLIDLRGQVTGDCREFEYDGKVHYLDDTAIEVFERQVRSFGDYTIGVYEAVKNTENNYRVMHKKQQQEAQQTPHVEELSAPFVTSVVRFGAYHQRREERMNYAVNVEMFNDLNKSIQATTVDMSVSGLRVKLNKEHMFKPGERLTVQFRGLEGEYTLDKKNGIPYTIVSILRHKKEQRLCLKRQEDTPTPSFDAFLERFIHGNKRRYKVNMDNTLDAIALKTTEQYYTPNFASVPVYLQTIEGLHSARFAMANECNKETLYYWSDEQYELKLGYLFNHERIAQLLDKPEGQRETTVYAFNHVKNEKVYFYSATLEELQSHRELAQVFLGYGARKASWRVYRVCINDMYLEQAHLPLSIPDSINDSVKRQNQPPPPRLLARLKHLTHIATLTDITEDLATQSYQRIAIRREDIAALKVFGHPRNKPPEPVNMFRFKYHNQRKETRYQLRSKVTLRVDDIVLEGVSEDVSVRGLKVELQSFFHDVENALVELSFPHLQKVTQKYSLVDLPYRVKGISQDRNVLHLQAISDESNTTAQAFFDELIKNNRSRLKAYREEEEIPGIGRALRNLHAQNMGNMALFIKKDGVDFIPHSVAAGQEQTRLLNLLKHDMDPGEVNLQFLYPDAAREQSLITQAMKKIKSRSSPKVVELLIAFNPSEAKAHDAVRSQRTDTFNTDEERKKFIESALAKGQFIAIKLFITRTGRPDVEFLQSEINYVGTYAIHRAKVLEEQLWNIQGVVEMVDVTDEVMTRFRFSPQHIAHNYAPPSQHNMPTVQVEHLLKA